MVIGLAVVAHPGDESFGLGAIIDGFVRAGTTASVLCLTHGETSTLQPTKDLDAPRSAELHSAAKPLGLASAVMLDHPDGCLTDVDVQTLTDDVLAQIKASRAEGLLVFDPSGVTGTPPDLSIDLHERRTPRPSTSLAINPRRIPARPLR